MNKNFKKLIPVAVVLVALLVFVVIFASQINGKKDKKNENSKGTVAQRPSETITFDVSDLEERETVVQGDGSIIVQEETTVDKEGNTIVVKDEVVIKPDGNIVDKEGNVFDSQGEMIELATKPSSEITTEEVANNATDGGSATGSENLTSNGSTTGNGNTTQNTAQEITTQGATQKTTAQSTTKKTTAVSTTTTKTTAQSTTQKTTAATTSNTTNDIKLTFTMGDSWGTGMTYNIVVTNSSNKSINGWEAVIEVPAGTVLNNSWNCNCSLSGNKLTISGIYVNPDYNTSVVPAKGKVDGLGISINTPSSNPIGNYVVSAGGSTSTGSGSSTGNGNSGSADTVVTLPPVKPETGSFVANHGALKVSGTQLVDKNGDPYRLCGVSTHGIQWYPQYVNKDTFKYLRDDWGVNMIRLAMYPREGGYLEGNTAQIKQTLENGIKYATELGMYVIVDWHVLNYNPQKDTQDAVAFFEEMAKKYANYDNIIYEICNEPTGSPWSSSIKPYAEKVVAAIRKYDKDAVIIVGTNNWSQHLYEVVDDRLADKNVMYALHFYAATHKGDLQGELLNALAKGLPVFISECSICTADGNGYVDEASATAWFDILRQNNVSYAIWSLCNKGEKAALISSSCSKLSGFSISDLSETGKWFRTRIRSDRGLD